MYLYNAFIVVGLPHTQGSQIRITQCYLQITLYLPLLRKRSPDGASPDWGSGHLIAAYYSSIDPERMKGWVGLVGWPIQLQVERRTGKVRRSKTDVLPRVAQPAKSICAHHEWLIYDVAFDDDDIKYVVTTAGLRFKAAASLCMPLWVNAMWYQFNSIYFSSKLMYNIEWLKTIKSKEELKYM